MTTKKLIKKALKNPELFSAGELLYIEFLFLQEKKKKSAKINKGKRENS